MKLERVSNALAGASRGLGDIINYKARKEIQQAEFDMQKQMENLRQNHRMTTLNRGAEIDEAAREDTQLFTTERDETLQGYQASRDETLQGYQSSRDETLYGYQTERDKTQSGYQIEAIKEQGAQARSAAYLKNAGAGAEDQLKLLQRWVDEVRKLDDPTNLMAPEDRKARVDALIKQGTIESGYDPSFVMQLALAAGEPVQVAQAMAAATQAARDKPAVAGSAIPEPGSGSIIPQPGSESLVSQPRSSGLPETHGGPIPGVNAAAQLFEDYVGVMKSVTPSNAAQHFLDWITAPSPASTPEPAAEETRAPHRPATMGGRRPITGTDPLGDLFQGMTDTASEEQGSAGILRRNR